MILGALYCILLGIGTPLNSIDLNSEQNHTELDQFRLVSQVQATGTPSDATITGGTTDGGAERATARSLDDIEQFSSPFKRILELHILLSDASEAHVLKHLTVS